MFWFVANKLMMMMMNGAAAVQRTRTRLGDRTFSIAGPRVWNNRPASLRQTVSAAAFKRCSWRLICIVVRLIANFRLLSVLFYCIVRWLWQWLVKMIRPIASSSSIYLPQLKTFIIITEYIWWQVARKTKRSSSWRPIINNSINYQ